MGATAEQWTASELRPLRRSGWRLINHYLLRSEIDHAARRRSPARKGLLKRLISVMQATKVGA
jgi:hypothetical protein